MMSNAVSLPYVSQQDIAAIMGVSVQSIKNWEREGLPVVAKGRAGQASKYLPADVVRWRVDQLTRRAQSGNDVGGAPIASMDEVKKRKAEAEAEMIELNLAKARGEVIPLSEIEKRLSNALAACRSRLLQIGSNIAPHVELLSDATEIKDFIDDAIHEALSEIKDEVFSDLGGSSGQEIRGDDPPSVSGDNEASAETNPEPVG